RRPPGLPEGRYDKTLSLWQLHLPARDSLEARLPREAIHLIGATQRHVSAERTQTRVPSFAHRSDSFRRVLGYRGAHAVGSEPFDDPAEQRGWIDVLEEQRGVDEIELRGRKRYAENVTVDELHVWKESVELPARDFE